MQQEVLAIAREWGVIRPRDFDRLGVNRSSLRRLTLAGILNKVGRGLYTLADYDATEHHTLVEAAKSQSQGVVCLLSALVFHDVGTQLPHQVWLAIPRGAHPAGNTAIPTTIVTLRQPAYEAGIEVHRLEGVDVPIYSVSKTVADCFKFRNKVGLDVAIEALRAALSQKRCTREQIRQFAHIDRVENVIRPYMETLSA